MTVVRRTTRKGGFTLVEILIVVIILGILAAIVIPQFTSASQDARKNSLVSQLQTIRSQIELYKLQHLDKLPPGMNGSAGSVASATAWSEMINRSNVNSSTGTDSTAYPFGPYLQAAPVNPLNGNSNVLIVTADLAPAAATGGAATDGFVFNKIDSKTWGTTVGGTHIYDEGNPSDSVNDQ
jgi:general secretion pathway protein G